MLEIENKKYASITVQSVILGTNVLLLQHTGPDPFIFISIFIVLSLFALQAINKRFFFYFPINLWANQTTVDWDTYILYGMTFLAFFFLLVAISQNFVIALVATIFIVSVPFVWRIYFYPKVRARIANKLGKGSSVDYGKCPCCGGKAIIGRKVLTWNKGYEAWTCLGECGRSGEGFFPLNVG